MGYQAYSEYKESRLEWLGNLPKHWECLRLRLLSKRFAGGTPDKKNDLYWLDGTIPWLNSGAVNQGVITQPSSLISELGLKESSAKWIPVNTVIIALAGQGKTKGTAAITKLETTCNQSMAAIVFESDHPKFMYWWLHSQYKNIRGMASDDGRDGLNLEMIGSIPCPRPSPHEQQKIAQFLDHKTAQIDRLIEKKQELIGKLQEQRSAIITMAVTKGLNAQALTGPCAQEWLGIIPDHWKRNQKLNFLSTDDRNSFVNGPFGSDLLTTELVNEGVPVIYSGDVKETGFQRKSDKYVTEEKAKQLDFCRVDGGDILLAKVGDPPGDACVYPIDQPSGIVTQDVVRIKVDKRTVDAEYLCFLLNSEYGRHLVRLVSVEATRGRFSLADLKSIRHILPPLEEQQEIVLHIHQQMKRCNRLSDLAIREIETLQEYRTALITTAVTGQIDVRNWQAPEPIKEPEPDMEVT